MQEMEMRAFEKDLEEKLAAHANALDMETKQLLHPLEEAFAKYSLEKKALEKELSLKTSEMAADTRNKMAKANEVINELTQANETTRTGLMRELWVANNKVDELEATSKRDVDVR